MKKTLTILGLFGLFLVQAQVGINTDTPDAGTDLELGSADKALLLNRVANVNAVSNPKEGMLVFDTSADYGCIRVYQRSGWTGCFIGGATESTAATITDKTKTLLVYTHSGVTHNGKINNTTDVLTIKIPYTNASGSYDRVSVTTTAAPGENGDSNTLTLNIPGGTFSANGELTATIKVGGADQEYLVRQSPGDISTIATFPVVMSGISYNVILKSSTAIPDRNFGNGTHDFLYLPVEVTGIYNVNGQPYKKTWLNMNLGAEYANTRSTTNFKPTKALYGSAAHIEPKTYGSYFQWQRKADGHEFKTSQTTSNLASSWTASGTWDGKFIASSADVWVSGGATNLTSANLEFWRSGGVNNPCPVGYHIPTMAEWEDFHEAFTGSRTSLGSNVVLNQTILPNLAAAGYRGYNGDSFGSMETDGRYWASEATNDTGKGRSLDFSPTYSSPISFYKSTYGFSTRCIKN